MFAIFSKIVLIIHLFVVVCNIVHKSAFLCIIVHHTVGELHARNPLPPVSRATSSTPQRRRTQHLGQASAQ